MKAMRCTYTVYWEYWIMLTCSGVPVKSSVAAVRLTTNRLHKTGYAVHHGFHNLT
jgi:hypothetical protein